MSIGKGKNFRLLVVKKELYDQLSSIKAWKIVMGEKKGSFGSIIKEAIGKSGLLDQAMVNKAKWEHLIGKE